VVAESRGTAVIWVVAAVLGAFALWRLTSSDGGAAAGGAMRIDRPAASASASGRARIYVHVAGAVRRPGVFRLPSGSRVESAVERAGGPVPRADLTGINLAARLEDGQQVVVPARAAVSGGAAAGAKPGLGTATADELDEVDGIGPTLAERIVKYRTENGGFGSIDELREVEGIGEKRLETLRDALQP
jgi:competence protein ComEA